MNPVEKKTVQGIYDNGELFLSEPVDAEGCWHVEVTFLYKEDEEVPLESSPHHPEMAPVPDRLEELQRERDLLRTPVPPYRLP